MPQITFDSLDTVPDGLREFAKEENGKVVVQVVAQTKLDEFRTNNINLAKERDTLKAVVSKIQPVIGEDVDGFLSSFQEMQGIVTKVKDGTLKGTDAIEQEVQNRVAAMKNGYDSQLTQAQQARVAAEQARDQALGQWRRSIVDNAVTAAAVAETSGALPTAIPDILRRAYGVFQVSEDGKLVAKDGDAIIYGADGATPMTPKEWVEGVLRTQAPHFFRNSNGGGAAGGGTAENRFGGFSKEDFAKLKPEQKLAIVNAQRK